MDRIAVDFCAGSGFLTSITELFHSLFLKHINLIAKCSCWGYSVDMILKTLYIFFIVYVF